MSFSRLSNPSLREVETAPEDVFSGVGYAFAKRLAESLGISLTRQVVYACTSVASTVVSVISSIYLISTQGAGHYFAFSVPVITSLTSLVCQVAALVELSSAFNFSRDKALNLVQQASTFFLDKYHDHAGFRPRAMSNAIQTPDLVRYAIQICTMIITAGMTKYNFTTADINAYLTLREKTSKLSTDATEFVTEMFADFGWADLDNKLANLEHYQHVLDKSMALLRYNLAQYIVNPALYNQLLDVTAEISDLLTKKLHKDEYQRYSTIRSQLSSTLVKLNEMRTSIAEITDGQTRIATTGLLLEGVPGVGKSEFANYLMRDICRALTLPTAVYDLKLGSSDKFFNVYVNQAAAIVNEFGATTEGDTSLRHMNSIVSSDPFNFESAFVKSQPCKLRIVTATTNRSDYAAFLKGMTEQALCAMMSRFVRVKVFDPKFTGRGGDNAHRSPDFSHLQFSLFTPKNTNFQNMNQYMDSTEQIITYEDLRYILLRRCVLAENRYIDLMVNNPNTQLTDEQRQTLSLRLDQLERMAQIYHPQYGMATEAPPEKPVHANSKTKHTPTMRHCIFRFQGGVGRGKSTTITKASNDLATTYNMPIKHIVSATDLQDYDPNTPEIYIFDDFPIHRNTLGYLEFVNNMHQHSVLFIGTNHVVPYVAPSYFSTYNIKNSAFSAFSGYSVKGLLNPLSTSFIFSMLFKFLMYMFLFPPAKAYMPNDENLHCNISDAPGILRRIGLEDRLVENYKPINLQPYSGKCFTSELNGGFSTPSDFHYSGEISDVVINHYANFLRESKVMCILRYEAPAFTPDVTINIRDFNLWRERVKTEKGYTLMFLNTDDPAGQVIVREEFIEKFLQRTCVQYWVMPNLKDIESLEDAVVSLCVTLRNALPDINVYIKSPTHTFALCNRTLYAYNTYETPEVITYDENTVYFDRVALPPAAIMKFIHNPHSCDIPVEFPGLLPNQLAVIKKWFLSNNVWHKFPVYKTANDTVLATIARMENIKHHPLVTYFTECSIGAKIVTALLVTLSTSAIVYGIYKFISYLTGGSSDTKSTKSNEDTDTQNSKYDDRNARYQEEYVRGVQEGKYKNPRQFAAVLYQRTGDTSISKSWEIYDSDIRSNSLEGVDTLSACVEMMQAGKLTIARRLFDEAMKEGFTFEQLHRYFQIRSNAVNAESEHTPDNSIIAGVMAKMRKAACQIVLNGNNMCYGIVYSGRRIVTVAHCFSDSQKPANLCIRFSHSYDEPAKEYPIKIVAINRDKDIAVCEVTDTSFPMQKNLESLLPHFTDTYQFNGPCYYLRPTQAGYIYQGYATRHAYSSYRKYDADNPNYRPATWYTYTYSQLLKVTDVFRSGDCGFPLIAIEQNKPVIIGIHNGYDGSGTAYFSPLSITEVADVVPPPTHANALEVQNTVLDATKHDIPTYNTYLEGTMEPDKLWTDYHEQLNVICRSPALYYHSNPVTKKKNYHDDKCQFDNPSLPSPITTKGLPETTIAKLPIDNKYRASPLMAQALKFGQCNPINMDTEILEQAKSIQYDMYRVLLGPLKILRPAQAINGIFGEPLKQVVLDTSPGPYIKKTYRMDNKKQLFVNHNASDPTKPAVWTFSTHPAAKELAQHMDGIMHSWSHGKPTLVLIKDNPKVELLPLEEVRDNGKIRLFCELDLAVNLVVRRLIGDFISKLQDNHPYTNCKTGVNFYRDLHWYAKSFPPDADVFGFDVRRMDKNLPSYLMEHFFWLVYQLLCEEHQNAAGYAYPTCAKSISTAIHTFEGLLYQTSRGNPSGITGTNQINTISLELIVIYAHIQICRTLPRTVNQHTSATYYAEVRGFLNGDNGYLAISPRFQYTQEKILAAFADFGLEILFDKSHLDGIEWCGRTIKKENGFLVPALRPEAIIRQLYWIDISKKSDIPNQFVVLQLEAALHSKTFFLKVQKDIIYISKKIGVPATDIQLFTWENVRAHYFKYVCGEVLSPVLTEQASDYLLRNLRFDTSRSPTMSVNWTGLYYEKCAKDKLPIDPHVSAKQDKTTLEWLCTVTDQGYTGEGIGARKNEARNSAFGVLYENRFGSSTTSNANFPAPTMHKHSVRYTYVDDDNNMGGDVTIFSDNAPVVSFHVTCTQETFKATLLDHLQDPKTYIHAMGEYLGIQKHNIQSEARNVTPPNTFSNSQINPEYLEPTSHPLVYRVKCESMTREALLQLDPDYFTKKQVPRKPQTKSNGVVGTSDSIARNPNLNVTGAEDAVSQGVSNRGGAAPQLTSTVGEPSPPQQVLESTGGLAKVTNLNPYGPTNQMSQGAICFDLPSLVYSQFMDTDQTYRVTDSMPVGTLVLQIPYNPLSEFVNPYARQWVAMHGRYNGDILLRINTISNQLFSGALTIFWYSRTYEAEIVSRTEIQKYSYQTVSLTMPSTEYYVLKDARSYLYYRNTDDSVLNDRPILGVAVHLPLRNPQRDGVYADIVIGSRLCNQFDTVYGATPFVVSDPRLTTSYSPIPVVSLNGQSLRDVFPQFGVNYLYMYSDGATTVPMYSLVTDGFEHYFDYRANVAGILGPTSYNPNKQRMFAAREVDDHTANIVLVYGQIPIPLSQKIAANIDNVVVSDNWKTIAASLSFLSSDVKIYVSRNNEQPLVIYNIDDTKPDQAPKMTLVQQTTAITSVGLIYVICIVADSGTGKMIDTIGLGIQDTAQHLPLELPHNRVLGPVVTADELVPLPSTWRTLKFNKATPPVITGSAETAPTTFSDPSVLYRFDLLSSNVGPREALQFTLLEPVAQTAVAVVRYLPQQKEFVINPDSAFGYQLYTNNAAELVISGYGTVRLDSGFPTTETGNWALRQPATMATMRRYRSILAECKARGYDKDDYVPDYGDHRVGGTDQPTLRFSTEKFPNWRPPTTRSNAALVPEAVLEMDGAMADMGDVLADMNVGTSTSTADESISATQASPRASTRDWYTQVGTSTRDRFSQTPTFNSTYSAKPSYAPQIPTPKSGSQLTPKDYMDYAIYGILPLTQSNGSVVSKPFEIMNSDRENDLNRQQQSDMQKRDQAFQASQQASAQTFQQQMQTGDQAFQTQMENQRESFAQGQQQRQFGFQTNMDNLDYSHNLTMQGNAFAQQNMMQANAQNFSKNMEETTFTHGLISSALGGAFGIADTAVGKIGDYFLEGEKFNDQTALNKQNYQNQSRLMTQNAALNIQAAGQTTQAMQLAQTQ